MRGEKSVASEPSRLRLGSPPHARGKGGCGYDKESAARITPACAGKSLRDRRWGCRRRDHPRMRGEKPPAALSQPCDLGSPPHARGKGFKVHSHSAKLGITPACAGKSVNANMPRLVNKDHPRMRGEKPMRFTRAERNSGSPPHARGKVQRPLFEYTPGRITPACAGKRLRKPRKINVPAVPHFGFHLVSQTRKRS